MTTVRALYLFDSVTQSAEVTSRALYAFNSMVQPDEVKARALFAYDSVIPPVGEPGKHRTLYGYDTVVDEPPFPYLERIEPSHGPAGSIVRLVGDGFGSDQAQFGGHVTFGSTECAIASWSWTEIHAIIPPEAEPGVGDYIQVTLTDPGVRSSSRLFFLVEEPISSNTFSVTISLHDDSGMISILDKAK